MNKWADYCISKISKGSNGLIDSVMVCSDKGTSLGDFEEKRRNWMVNQINLGKTFCSITRNKNFKNNWNFLSYITYNGLFTWYKPLPQNLTTHNSFVSYYHDDDESYRIAFDNLFDDLIISQSVELGDIDSDNSADYVKQLINDKYLDDTTVLVVLIGANTKHRKHVDWEISGALSFKVGDEYAGILGLFLPTHPDYSSEKYHKSSIPLRLQKNADSGYAILRDWTEDRVNMQEYIELAFANRDKDELIINSEISQMKYNTSE